MLVLVPVDSLVDAVVVVDLDSSLLLLLCSRYIRALTLIHKSTSIFLVFLLLHLFCYPLCVNASVDSEPHEWD